ncbi:MAG TPA: DUF4386 domain-containing protein [Chitinophagaceae bacterium]|nr:DUF4386 domain-containing protein [Chitinophagaceae bacterium]
MEIGEINSVKKTAKLAGLFWVLSAAAIFFNLQIVHSKIFFPNDAASIATNIIANESLYRAGIASYLFAQLFLLCFGLTIFRLFKGVNKTWSSFFLSAILLTVALAFVNAVFRIGALLLLKKPDYLGVFQAEQLNAMMMFSFRLSDAGQLFLEIFWGFYLFALGLLFLRSGFVPKILGFLLIVQSIIYPFNTFTKLVIPQFYPAIISQLTIIFGAIGAPTMFWLLIKGAKEKS